MCENRRMRIRRSVVALFLGLSLASGVAWADTSTGGKKDPAKGKPGDTCKVDADCDQSSGPHSCVKTRCRADKPEKPYPPPVT
jgi:hypothetical protein